VVSSALPPRPKNKKAMGSVLKVCPWLSLTTF
jgi:hypothetical protein